MRDSVRQRWDGYWARQPEDERDATWLAPFEARLRQAGSPLLELGCGAGVDTATLARLGPLVALDYSPTALSHVRARVPEARCVLADLRDSLPFQAATFGAVVASLSLHYFDRATTHAILADVRRCLRSGGLLLARVNSSCDVAYGANSDDEIEPRFFQVKARPKRFFDEDDVRTFFGACFELEDTQHAVVGLSPEKWAWTVLARVARRV